MSDGIMRKTVGIRMISDGIWRKRSEFIRFLTESWENNGRNAQDFWVVLVAAMAYWVALVVVMMVFVLRP